MAATADRVPCVFIENGVVANYDPTHPIEVSYVKNFDGEPTGRKNQNSFIICVRAMVMICLSSMALVE